MPIFPPDRYNFQSLYILNNGWYIDFLVDGTTTTAITKTPEGAEWQSQEILYATSPKFIVDELITDLSNELNEEGLVLQEILKKQTPPPKTVTNRFEIVGRLVNKTTGDPIVGAQITPTLIGFPPPPPSLPNNGAEAETLDAFQELQTDFSSEIFSLGTAIIVDPTTSGEGGQFIIEYQGDEAVDFTKSNITISAGNYFPTTKGPTLSKTGEKSVSKSSTTNKFQGSTTQIDLKLSQQSDGKYKAEVTLKNNDTEQVVVGVGISQDREIAKKKARSKAEQQFTQVDTSTDTFIVGVYDLGVIKLEPLEINLDKEKAKIEIEVQEIENKIAYAENIAKLPFQARMAIIFATLKETIKTTLLPILLNIVAKFGITVVHNFVSKTFQPFNDYVCPPKEQVLEAIKQRNQLVRKLNSIYKTVRTISKLLGVVNALIIGFRIGIKIAKFTPTPPFAPSGAIASTIDKVEKQLEIAGIVVSILTILAASIGAALGVIIAWLEGLDFMFVQCAEEEDISFEEINKEINSFVDPTTSPEEVGDDINPITNEILPYKGFTFEIKQDTSQNFQYPKRYAIARNIQGIQVLRSESSFASNPTILIEELKFVIDRDNLRAD